MATPTGTALMEKLVALCRRRGFIFQSSEIYGGINGFWDYGPLGVELKNNLRDAWWDAMVRNPPPGPDGREIEIVGLDCSIISHPKVWEASGHVGGFSDPMQTCRQCKKLFRADHIWELLQESDWVKALRGEFPGVGPEWIRPNVPDLMRWVEGRGKKIAKGLALVKNPGAMRPRLESEFGKTPDMGLAAFLGLVGTEPTSPPKLPCPECGGDLTDPRQFNLMFETYVGAVRDEDSKAYLRPETAQGMFYNFKNVMDSTRVKVPFGICQVGRSFRNEVTPRNFIFRSREFEQMELEFFVHPNEATMWYEYWRKTRWDWWCSLGLAGKNLRLRDHDEDELAHYAKGGGGCCDVEYAFPFSGQKGFTELEGIAYRSNYDLTQHQKVSGAKLEYFDQERNERFLPHVIEPAAGLTRGLLAVLCEAYTVDESRPSPELMRFHPRLAPIKAGVFPLVNKDGMPEIAEGIYRDVRKQVGPAQYDAKQSIGKRYARMDEAGTPFCVTVDGQTTTDQTVTVRDRDTGAQVRVAADQVVEYLRERVTAGAGVTARPFGSTGARVPVVGQGTWNMERDGRKAAVAALRAGLDSGLTHVDTAEMYGSGRVEELVGEAIAGRRDAVFLVSKVLPSNASHDGVLRACEASLRRLGTDRLDCYLLHWPGRHPLAQTIGAFEQLVQEGKTRAWGVSNFAVDDLEEALAIAGPGRIACNQVLYHLGERAIEHRVVPWCARHGVTVVGYSPFGSGSFPSTGSAGGRVLAEVARTHGVAPHAVALAFLVRDDGLLTIPKSAQAAHVRDNAAAADLVLSVDEVARIDRAFPRGRARPGVPVL